MKATKETQDLKEKLQRDDQMKQAAKKRQEKLDDLEAKRRIKAKIEADREERRRKTEEEKAAREGRSVQGPSQPAPPVAATASKPTANHAQARLRLQIQDKNVTQTLAADTTLFELAQLVEREFGFAPTSFTTTFPKKTFEGHVDFGKTLKEAGLVPSAVLIVK